MAAQDVSPDAVMVIIFKLDFGVKQMNFIPYLSCHLHLQGCARRLYVKNISDLSQY